MLIFALALIASLEAAAQGLDEAGQEQKIVEKNTTFQPGQSQVLASNSEMQPDVTLSNIEPWLRRDMSSKVGTFLDTFQYVIFPPIDLEPPQRLTVIWIKPKTNEEILKSIPQVWKDISEPCYFQIKIPKGYFTVGQITALLKIVGKNGTQTYSIAGPNIYLFFNESVKEPNTNGDSYKYVLNIKSDKKFEFCNPKCDFGDGYKDIEGDSFYNRGKGDKMEEKSWSIPKELGKPSICEFEMRPMQ